VSVEPVSRLVAAGMSRAAAEAKAALFEAAARALQPESGASGAVARWFVPGRIEVMGKHTDYAGGRSLLAAVERGFALLARPRRDARVLLRDAARGLEAELAMDAGLPPASGGWQAYATTVVRRVARDFPGASTGADVAFASDLPRASGMSSSSALVVAIFTAVAAVNRLDERPEYAANIRSLEDLAEYLGCVENGYAFRAFPGDAGVGTFGGSEDHTAILCCRAGRLSRYAFRPVRAEGDAPLPPEWTFVLADSGIAADKTGNAKERYNRASLATRAILELWNVDAERRDETLADAVRLPDGPAAIRRVLNESTHPGFSRAELLDRFDQFVEESEVLVPAAGDAFARGDGEALGRIVGLSQELAERKLGNQIPQTIELARSARALGAIAASAFGGGFGGSVWALAPAAVAEDLRARWAEDYRARFPEAAAASAFFVSGAGPGRLAIDRPSAAGAI